ncbi:AM-toxin biosynthesis regulator 1 [Hyphodiscus hymeniophilus]|uniref:AM-toxin biosynthesis regulator 1 n=1 Tax=Hyphodiscus hymeniophilus TaxID=353542 RepID=A0A9P7AXQ0_9HELO|nr:AM-toxin biosynthesis regulator 1 [Hyphodiscus hymeniophilus]
MVYCGKPSLGCASCRQRKTRCDKVTPSCGQCVRAERECPGYRNQLDLMFRSENNAVIGKIKVQESDEIILALTQLPRSFRVRLNNGVHGIEV